MTAPAHTNRINPSTASKIALEDGFSSVFAFAIDPDVALWEKTVKPPGYDGGEPIDTTTMHNSEWRTMAPRQLITMSALTGTAAYDPVLYTQLRSLINVEGAITQHFPDGSKISFYGFLQKWEPDALAEGKQPECQFTIVVTNQDPTTGAEEDPVYVDVAGT